MTSTAGLHARRTSSLFDGNSFTSKLFTGKGECRQSQWPLQQRQICQ